MTRRSRFFIVFITLFLVVLAVFVVAKPQNKREYMAVLTAKSASVANATITLQDPSPNTLMFSDRPNRDVQNATPETVASWWRTEEFKSDLPNVAVTWHNDSGSHTQIVELDNPIFNNGAITFDYAVLSSEKDNFTEALDNVSLFIDAFPTAVNSQVTD